MPVRLGPFRALAIAKIHNNATHRNIQQAPKGYLRQCRKTL